MPITNHLDHDAERLRRMAQEDPWVMYLVARRERLDQPQLVVAAAAQATILCVEALATGEHAEAFEAWFAHSFRKVTLRANEREWEALVADHPHIADRSGCVLALPPIRKSERPRLLTKLQACKGDVETVEKAPAPFRDEAVNLVINADLSMSLGKAASQAGHVALILHRHLANRDSELLAEWQKAGHPFTVSAATGDLWVSLRADKLTAVCRDAGLTEVASGSETVLARAPRRAG